MLLWEPGTSLAFKSLIKDNLHFFLVIIRIYMLLSGAFSASVADDPEKKTGNRRCHSASPTQHLWLNLGKHYPSVFLPYALFTNTIQAPGTTEIEPASFA